MFKISDLSFGYRKNDNLVLNGLDLELADGEVGVLLGPNGSGKTTLFKNIIGLEKPAGGNIAFDGADLGKMSGAERARLIGYVPQDITFGALSVYESVMVGRLSFFGYRPSAADRKAVDDVLMKMGLKDFADRNVDRLSGGERQKIAIARALAQEPKLLIFDEPTGNLDISNEFLILKEARRLSKDYKISILTAIHDLNRAFSFGDRFFFLKDGKIKYNVTREEITEDMIKDVFNANVRILNIDGEKYIIGEKLL